VTSTTAETERKWRRLVSSVYAFLDDKTVLDGLSEVPKNDLYAAYAEWCQEDDLTPKRKGELGQEMARWRPGVVKSYPRIEGKRVWCWRGIRLKNGEEEAGQRRL